MSVIYKVILGYIFKGKVSIKNLISLENLILDK